jgi:hypothetical protein
MTGEGERAGSLVARWKAESWAAAERKRAPASNKNIGIERVFMGSLPP